MGFRYGRDARGAIIKIGLLSLVAAQFQAVALVLLVPLAKTIAEGRHTYRGSLGPISVGGGTGTLVLLAAGAIVTAAALEFWIAWQRARLVAHWEREQRDRIL